MLGALVYKPELKIDLIISASRKVLATIISIFIIFKNPYAVHQAHLKMIKIMVDAMGTVAKGVTIFYIGYLAIDFKEPSSFFYMNSFIVMIINIFAQSSNHSDLMKVKVTGYFYFIMFLTSITLVGCTGLILWMYWIAYHKDESISAEKRAFIYGAYKVDCF